MADVELIMKDNELLTLVREQRDKVPMTTPVEQVISRGRQLRARRRVRVLSATFAATAAAVLTVAVLVPGSQASSGRVATHSLRVRLLAAIDAARGDILMTYGPHAPHTGFAYELIYPWYPRPGQQVTFRDTGRATNGKLFADTERIFAMPAGQGTAAISPVTGTATFSVTGTFLVLYPARHAWGKWLHSNTVFEMPADAAGIRHQLASGRFRIIRRDVLDGHKAIELGMTGLSQSKTGLHATADLLWVSAGSHLPLREVLRFSTGRQDVMDFRFLPPTAANVAKLHIVIPTGYHRTWLRPGQRPWKHHH
jgi:hypothetical protein